MLSEIDPKFRPVFFDDFLESYIPRPTSPLPQTFMKEARDILVNELNRDYAQVANENILYPALVSFYALL